MATKDTGGQRHTSRRSQDEEATAEQSTKEVEERHEKLTDDVDAILDEIDEVLEEMPRSSSGPTSRRAGSDRLPQADSGGWGSVTHGAGAVGSGWRLRVAH